MRSKTILAAILAGALGAPLAVLADDGASTPCSPTPGDEQSSTQSSPSGDDEQLAQNGTDDSLTAEPANPYGSTGDPNLRQSSVKT